MDIIIKIPFDNAELLTHVWANEEKNIDFRNEPERAARCTTAFAALELKQYLSRALKDFSITFVSEHRKCDFYIELRLEGNECKSGAFTLTPLENGVLITSQGRTGILYGAYEFLRLQGWRWQAPGKEGEVVPQVLDKPIVPMEEKECIPSISTARGFYFEGPLKESEELWLWMARNRLNLAAYRSNTAPLLNKLGMVMQVGGHIFEKLLDPDKVLESGNTLWDEHEDWYGLPEEGTRKKANALMTQFCVSNMDLLNYISKEFLQYLNGEWKEAENVDVWNFDTWGSSCSCNKCSKIGNSTDKNLYLLSFFRKHIDQARMEGRLDHDIKLVMCSYEGTATIEPPQNQIPGNLITSGDFIVFYPILRCYEHNLNDPSCSYNRDYAKALKGWYEKNPCMPVMQGEYYNVSKFEDLPIMFTRRMVSDIPYYCILGASSITYMHLPMSNWGMRTLTQLLYAQLAWNAETDVFMFMEEYFKDRYGDYSNEMRKVYELLEVAWSLCTSWRAWGKRSILSKLLTWDGGIPETPFEVDDHFTTRENAVESGRKSIEMMKEAIGILDEIRNDEKSKLSANSDMSIEIALNPIEVQKKENASKLELRLGEDKRFLVYGIDTMKLMTGFLAYHNSLYNKNWEEAKKLWGEIEVIAEKLDSYYIPLSFEHVKVGVSCKDALSRTQIRDLLRRCRSRRVNI